jgi:dUTP pyrophosphatase
VEVRVVRLDPRLALPRQQHADDAGYDLHARDSVTIPAGGGRGVVPTGLAIAIPPGYAGFVVPRSGLALTHGVTCLNTPGLIDPLYRGELKVLLVNTDPDRDYTVSRGDRVAQLVLQRVETVDWIEVDELDETVRDRYGFGSTGR